ncbi:12151_t:CDS:2 [Entrophospora sp. SA101]|nr:12151_t:CDS:2 [Entrophospora sp. SA101]CAJ0825458.1 12180_t:CDS:2 [Entrophospora sp. SA101]
MSTRKPDRKGKKTLRLENALQEKEMGNGFFKRGNYELAIEHYGKAIEHDPKESIYFINRAMAYLKLQKWEKAEKDSITSELDKVLDAIRMREEKSNQKLLSENNKSSENNQDTPNKRRLSIEIVEFDEDDDKIVELAGKKSKEEKIVKNGVDVIVENNNINNININNVNVDWKKYEQNDENLYLYFKIIPPSSYPKIFSDFFEIGYLLKIMIILKNRDNANDIYEVLYNLSRVSRFEMILMFLENEKKQEMKEMMKGPFDLLFKSTRGSSNQQKFTMDDVLKLTKIYGVE